MGIFEMRICPLLMIFGSRKPLVTKAALTRQTRGQFIATSAALRCCSVCLTVYEIKVALSTGTSKGQEHSKTPAASLHRREGGEEQDVGRLRVIDPPCHRLIHIPKLLQRATAQLRDKTTVYPFASGEEEAFLSLSGIVLLAARLISGTSCISTW